MIATLALLAALRSTPLPESLPLVNGKTLAVTTSEKPILFVAFTEACPHTKSSIPLFNKLSKILSPKVQLVGVLHKSLNDTKEFSKRLSPKFLIAADEDAKFIEATGAQHALDLCLVENGKASAITDGVSRGLIQKLLKGSASPEVNALASKVGFFQEDKASGCSLD